MLLLRTIEKSLDLLRFRVGDLVMCHTAHRNWELGTVMLIGCKVKDEIHPYQIKLGTGRYISAPVDEDNMIRCAPTEAVDWAIFYSEVDDMKKLLVLIDEMKMDIDMISSILFLAAAKGDAKDVFFWLLTDKEIDPCLVRDKDGKNALMIAIENKNNDLIMSWIEEKYSYDKFDGLFRQVDNVGNTILHYCIMNYAERFLMITQTDWLGTNFSIFNLINLDDGYSNAKLHLWKNNEGLTALELAKKLEYDSMINVIEKLDLMIREDDMAKKLLHCEPPNFPNVKEIFEKSSSLSFSSSSSLLSTKDNFAKRFVIIMMHKAKISLETGDFETLQFLINELNYDLRTIGSYYKSIEYYDFLYCGPTKYYESNESNEEMYLKMMYVLEDWDCEGDLSTYIQSKVLDDSKWGNYQSDHNKYLNGKHVYKVISCAYNSESGYFSGFLKSGYVDTHLNKVSHAVERVNCFNRLAKEVGIKIPPPPVHQLVSIGHGMFLKWFIDTDDDLLRIDLDKNIVNDTTGLQKYIYDTKWLNDGRYDIISIVCVCFFLLFLLFRSSNN